MLVAIEFHKALLPFTNGKKTLKANLSQPTELMSFLENMFPKMRQLIGKIKSGVIRENLGLLDKDNNLVPISTLIFPKKFARLKTIKIIPLIFGGGRAFGSILLGLALVAAAFIPGIGQLTLGGAAAATGAGAAATVATTGTTLGSILFGIGSSLILSGLSSLLLKPPKSASDTGTDRRENNIFSGITNTTSTRTPVALCYGRNRVGGQIISAYLKSEQITSDDGKPARTIKVSSYFL